MAKKTTPQTASTTNISPHLEARLPFGQRQLTQIIVALVLLSLLACYTFQVIPEQVAMAVSVLLWTAVGVLLLRLLLTLVISVKLTLVWLRLTDQQLQQAQLLTEGQRIENRKAEREANLIITVANAGDQVYLTEVEPTSVTRPLHLAPGRVNGLEIEPAFAESQRWAAYHLLHGSSRRHPAPEPFPANEPVLAPGQAELPSMVRLLNLLPPGLRGDMHNLVLGVRLTEAGQLERLTISLHDLFHTLVAASSGWGKSVFVASILAQLATCPDPVEFILIDQQEHGLAAFKGCDRLRYPLLRQPGEILSALREVYDEATRSRSEMFARCDADNLMEYNHLADTPLPPVIVAVDEASALLTGDREISAELKRQAWELRKFGIYQVLCLTSAKGTTIDTDHRQQFSSKVQLHANDKYQARLLMDAIEATTFPPGRAVIELPKQPPVVVQTPYIDKREVRSLLRPGTVPLSAPVVTPSAQERRVLELAAAGWSHSAICHEVWGYKSSKLYPQIDEILQKFGPVHRAPGVHEG